MKTGSKGGPSNQGGGKASIRGSGESYFEMQVRLLDNRENKIKDMLEKLVKKRAVQKLQRTRREYPVVAILGYTNSGNYELEIFAKVYDPNSDSVSVQERPL